MILNFLSFREDREVIVANGVTDLTPMNEKVQMDLCVRSERNNTLFSFINKSNLL